MGFASLASNGSFAEEEGNNVGYLDQSTYDMNANQMVPDLYRPLTEDDTYYPITILDAEGNTRWTLKMHESYDDETIQEFEQDHRPMFVNREMAERWAWYWIEEGVEDDQHEEMYSEATKAFIEALEGSDEEEEWDLHAWSDELHRFVIRLRGYREPDVAFLTVNDAHQWICERDGYGEPGPGIWKIEWVPAKGILTV